MRNRGAGDPRSPALPGGWTTTELATFGAVASALLQVPEATANRIALASAGRMGRHLARGHVRGIRIVLRVLELPYFGWLFGGMRQPFSRLSDADREAELRRWATSRFVARRSGFQALKRIIAFQAYAESSPAGRPNPLQLEVGYVPPVEPVTTHPTALRAFALPEVAPDRTIELDADVVVVGSGAGGGVVARELAAAGLAVLVLEAGPLLLEPDLPTDEADACDRLFLDGALTGTWDGSMTIVAGSGVGGGTTVNWTTCIEPPAAMRSEWAKAHGLDGFDGPEAEADIAVLRAELGLAGPPNLPPKDRLLLDGAAALGIGAGTLLRNAAGCGDCGSCGFGCRRGAKRSTLRVHLASAHVDGARIVPDATARRVVSEGGRVQAVEAIVATPVGRRGLRVHTRQVVVAGGALRTPGLLEHSGVDHPALGRYLRLQPVSILMAFGRRPVDMWHGTMQAANVLAWAPGTARASGHAGFTIESMPGHLGILGLALPWRGRADFAALMRRARFVSPVIAITRDAGWGTVRATRDGRTRIDYPLTVDGVRTLRAGLVASAEIARAGGASAVLAPGEPAVAWSERVGDLAGASSDWAATRHALKRFDYAACRGVVLSAHQLGSARMGAGLRDHPVDPYGRVRLVPGRSASGDGHPAPRERVMRGLYVADGSLFPTGLGVNPMFTIMLLARRVARTVAADR